MPAVAPTLNAPEGCVVEGEEPEPELDGVVPFVEVLFVEVPFADVFVALAAFWNAVKDLSAVGLMAKTIPA